MGSNGQIIQDGDSPLDILADVSLESFTANPTAIVPFGASVLRWSVTGPISGFHVELNGQGVTKSGEQVVQPASTATYRLTANAGQFSKALSTIQVAVDSSSCQINPIVNPQSAIQAPVTASIVSDGKDYFRDGSLPIVTFSSGSIRLQLQLGHHIGYFPDPDVNIDASFGLAVHNGALEATAEQISVDIGFPWWQSWVWGIPGAVPALAITLDAGKEHAQKKMHNGILGIVKLLNLWLTPPKGFHMQSVRIDVDNNGAGIIETTECRDDLLQQLAAISQVNAPTG